MGIAGSIVFNRKNIFMYGNNETEMEEKYLKFPFLLSKICDFFSFPDCNFGVQKSKQSTARIALWKIVNTPAVYTIEASFFGPNIGSLRDKHFETEDYQLMGSRLCEAFINYFDLQGTIKSEIIYQPIFTVESDYIEAVKSYKETHHIRAKIESISKETIDTPQSRFICESSAIEDDGSDSNPSEYGIDKEECKQMQDMCAVCQPEKKENKIEPHSVKSNKTTLKDRPPIKCGVVHRGQVSFNIAPIPAKPFNKIKSVVIHRVRKTKSSKTGRVSASGYIEMKDKEMQTDGDPRAILKTSKNEDEKMLIVPESIREAYQLNKKSSMILTS